MTFLAAALAHDTQRTITRARARMHVIPYDPKYLDEVLARAREMHAESALHRDVPLNEAKLIEQFEASRSLDHVYFRLVVRDEEVVGGFFGMVSATFFSDALMAKDLAWFVKRNARGSAAAVALLADFEEWAASKGAHHIVIGQSTGVKIDVTKNLFERLGYTSVGVNTVKRI